jgi:hypothetical protein
MRFYLSALLFLLLVGLAQAQQPTTAIQICQQLAGNQIGQISELAAQLQNANVQITELKKQLDEANKLATKDKPK